MNDIRHFNILVRLVGAMLLIACAVINTWGQT